MIATLSGDALYTQLRRADARMQTARMDLAEARAAFELVPDTITARSVRRAEEGFEDASAVAQEFGLPNAPSDQ